MAKIKDLEAAEEARLEFTYLYYEDFGMGGGAIFGITLLALLITLLLAMLLLLFLNKYQVINLYIPRKLRVFFIKKFITPEQESAYLAEEATVGAIDETKRL
jgi:hypothetical protein